MTRRALCHVLAEHRILLSKANLQALLLVNEDLQVTAAGLDMKSVEQLSRNDRYRTLKKLTAEETTLRANCTEDEAALADDTAEEYHQTYLSNASSAYELNPEAVKRDTQIVEERIREEYESTSLASAPSARKLEDWTSINLPDKHYLGKAEHPCKHCHALLYKDELKADGSGGTACCYNGDLKDLPIATFSENPDHKAIFQTKAFCENAFSFNAFHQLATVKLKCPPWQPS